MDEARLKSIPLFAGLSRKERKALAPRADEVELEQGRQVVREGAFPYEFFAIADGTAEVRRGEQLLAELGPGDFFGEMAVVSPGPRNATIVALEATETMGVHRDVLEGLRAEHPGVDRLLIEALVTEVRRLSALLSEALYLPVDKRAWRRLLELARVYGGADGRGAVVPLTQEDLAQVVGTTRPTINKLLRGAEDDGLVRVRRGRLEILDPEALARRAL